MLDMWHECNK